MPSKDNKLENIIDLIANEVGVMMKSEHESGKSLSKADPGEESPGEKKPEGSSIEGTTDEAGSDDGGDSAPPSDDASSEAPPADDSASGAPPAGGEGAPTGDPAADASAGAISPEAIEGEIAHLSVEELKMYLLAFKSALVKKLGVGGAPAGGPPMDGATPPPAPAGAPGADPGADPSMGDPAMGKGEMDDQSGKVTTGTMAKSEGFKALAEVSTLKKALAGKDEEIAALKKSMEEGVERIAVGFQNIMNKATAQRKSASGISFVTKPGTMAKSEKSAVDVMTLDSTSLTKALRDMTAKPDLKKSDRDLITRFQLDQEPREKLAHLFVTE
jgi:hypothetical protein